MNCTLIVAEKPSVARDIAKVLKVTQFKKDYLEGNGYWITWAFGHLVTLPQPHEIDPVWKTWRKETLPMIPKKWPLSLIPRTQEQFNVIQGLMQKCEKIICATDAGREGELIFRYIYEAAQCKKPVQRLWVSSLTPEAIELGFKTLQSWKKYDSLAAAARARSQADWLIGMNLSRAYAITSREPLFVGRVQTPTLAMIVKRDLEIINFKPEDYFEIHASFTAPELFKPEWTPQKEAKDSQVSYEGFYLGEQSEIQGKKVYLPKKMLPHPESVQVIVDRIKTGSCKVGQIEAKTEKVPPPLLYDLTELQRHANRLLGFSASKTLEIAQVLYEKHKSISYPRTDSRYLSETVANTLPKIVLAIRAPYENDLIPETGLIPLGPRFVNDQEISDHHAIIPTGLSLNQTRISKEENQIFDLICRRLLSAWQGDFVTDVTTVLTEVLAQRGKTLDIFRSQGRVVQKLGWKRLEIKSYQKDFESLPSGLSKNLNLDLSEIKSELKKTKSAPPLTEAALLTAMETSGRTLDDQALAAVMKNSGLGTPATRSGIIETLLIRGYVERKGKSLISTDFGKKLIDTVHTSVKSPELTARWERELSLIQEGKQSLEGFMKALSEELKTRIAEVLSSTSSPSYRPSSPLSIPIDLEKKITDRILTVLSLQGARPAGKLFQELTQDQFKIQRNEFEQVLQNLSGSKRIKITQETFTKEGKPIVYRKVAYDFSF